MIKDKRFLLSMAVLFMLTIGFASASEALDVDDASYNSLDTPLEVEDGEDLSASDDGANLVQASDDEPLTATVKPSGKTFNDIQTAVNNAKANDVIELDGKYTSSGKTIAVKKSLTFNGVNGATLDAKKLSGIFHITNKVTVNFNNITFINAKNGVMFVDSDGYVEQVPIKVNIDGCNFKDNYNYWTGAAIYAFTSGLCKITNSNFTNNYIKDPEGLKYPDSYGGAIYAYNLEITNCNFINNHAERSAGAISVEDTAKITDCFFKGNYANSGGAIEGSKLYLTNTIFESNSLKTDSSLNRYRGGAICAGTVNAVGCTFRSNSAGYKGGKGGAIYAVDVEVTNCSFEKNTANFAGAIFVDNAIGEDDYEPGLLKINNCKFISNGEAAVRSPKIIVDNSKTFNNKALDNNMKAITLLKASSKKLVTTYYSGKTLKIKVTTTPSSKPAVRILLLAVAKSSKKSYSLPITTNSKGIATIKASKLNAGTYKITVYEAFCIPGADPGDEKYVKVPGVLTKTSLKVKKTKAIVKAPKVKFKYKKSKYFKVTLKHKSTKKPMGGIKLKLKVYTGKKYKTYNVKTNKKGVAKFNTKKLSRGNHKVKVKSGNKNVILSKKSLIRIR